MAYKKCVLLLLFQTEKKFYFTFKHIRKLLPLMQSLSSKSPNKEMTIFLQFMGKKKSEKPDFEGNKSTSLSPAIWLSKSPYEITPR